MRRSHLLRGAPADRAIVSATRDFEIPFQDVDPAQIVWHGNYLRYFEEAREALLRKLDFDYAAMHAAGYAWPVIDVRVRYVQPVRYAQRIRVCVGLTEWESQVRFDYLVNDIASGRRLTTGYTLHCAVRLSDWSLQLVTPPALIDRLQPYL